MSPALSLGIVLFLVVDEADTMLKMEFCEQIGDVVERVGRVRVTCLFGTTFLRRLGGGADDGGDRQPAVVVRVSSVTIGRRNGTGIDYNTDSGNDRNGSKSDDRRTDIAPIPPYITQILQIISSESKPQKVIAVLTCLRRAETKRRSFPAPPL